MFVAGGKGKGGRNNGTGTNAALLSAAAAHVRHSRRRLSPKTQQASSTSGECARVVVALAARLALHQIPRPLDLPLEGRQVLVEGLPKLLDQLCGRSSEVDELNELTRKPVNSPNLLEELGKRLSRSR